MDPSPAPLPTITAKEVSWHATVAAIRARKQAELLGMDPQARTAIAHAAAAESGATDLPVVSLGTLWAMGEIEKFIGPLCGQNENLDQILVCHTLLHPEDVLMAALEGDLEPIRTGMVLTSQAVTAVRSARICRWFDSEMSRVKAITGGADAEPPVKK